MNEWWRRWWHGYETVMYEASDGSKLGSAARVDLFAQVFLIVLTCLWLTHLGSILTRLGSILGHLGSILAHLGSTWLHLGSSWLHLGPSCLPKASPKPPQTTPKPPQTTPTFPPAPQRPPEPKRAKERKSNCNKDGGSGRETPIRNGRKFLPALNVFARFRSAQMRKICRKTPFSHFSLWFVLRFFRQRCRWSLSSVGRFPVTYLRVENIDSGAR